MKNVILPGRSTVSTRQLLRSGLTDSCRLRQDDEETRLARLTRLVYSCACPHPSSSVPRYVCGCSPSFPFFGLGLPLPLPLPLVRTKPGGVGHQGVLADVHLHRVPHPRPLPAQSRDHARVLLVQSILLVSNNFHVV